MRAVRVRPRPTSSTGAVRSVSVTRVRDSSDRQPEDLGRKLRSSGLLRLAEVLAQVQGRQTSGRRFSHLK